MNPVFVVGVYLLIGFLGGYFARRIKFPTITGYIVVGVLFSLLHIIPKEVMDQSLSILVEIALGIIGYLVGGKLSFDLLKRFGRQIILITISQLMGSWILVTLILTFLGPLLFQKSLSYQHFFQHYFPMALIIGAISCATAPAAIVSIIREYRAKGPLTHTLLSVVALDDALCIIAYAIGLNIADMMVNDTGELTHIFAMLLQPMVEISYALLLGFVLGMAVILVSRLTEEKSRTLVIVMGFILINIGIARVYDISNILANMTMGFVVTNFIKHNRNVFEVIDDVADVVFAMFFTLAGAFFDIEVINYAGILSIVIVLSRCIGKYFGARFGAVLSGATLQIKRYLGFGLCPKAGVTVGLIVLAREHAAFAGIENIVLSAVLTSVILNELIAPPLTKYALIKAGEAYQGIQENRS